MPSARPEKKPGVDGRRRIRVRGAALAIFERDRAGEGETTKGYYDFPAVSRGGLAS